MFIIRHRTSLRSLTVKWPFTDVIRACKKLEELTVSFRHTIPITFENGNVSATTCFMKFPQLNSIKFMSLSKENLQFVYESEAASLMWIDFISSATARSVTIYDTNCAVITKEVLYNLNY